MSDLIKVPSIQFSNEELAEIVHKNPIILSDLELRVLLACGEDKIAVDGNLIDISPQSSRWMSWKIELDGRLLIRQTRWIKYSTWAATITAAAALITAIVTLFSGCALQSNQEKSISIAMQQKISASVIVVANKLEAGASPAKFATGSVRADKSGRIQVYVHVAKLTPDMLTALVEHGLEQAISSPPLHVVQGWVMPQKLDALAALPFVTRIAPPQYGYPH